MPTIAVSEVPQFDLDEELVGQWVEERLNRARNLFIMNISRPGGRGRVYRRGTGTEHQASAPGEYPASDSGALASPRGVGVVMESHWKGSLQSNVRYAKFLTEGTRYMLPRKMLADALTESMAEDPLPDELARAVKITTVSF